MKVSRAGAEVVASHSVPVREVKNAGPLTILGPAAAATPS